MEAQVASFKWPSYGTGPVNLLFIPSVLLGFLALFLLSRKRKRLPPSPPGYPIIGHLGLLGKLPHQDLHRIAQKYGPLVFLTLGFHPTLVASSPDMAMEFLKNHDRSFASRPSIAAGKVLLYNQLTIGLSIYGDHWKKMRKLLIFKLLTPKRLQETLHIRSEELASTLRIIAKESKRGRELNLTKIISVMSVNIITRVAIGRRCFGEKTDKAVHLFDLLHQLFVFFGTFYLADYFPFLWWLDFRGEKAKMKKLHAELDKFYDNLIEEHKQKREQKKGKQENSWHMLDALLDLSEEDTELTPIMIKGLIQDALLGGTDTSSNTVEWALSELLQAPSILKKAQEEIDQTVKTTNGLIEESSLENLKYLRAVVMETFRLHPVLPLLVQHSSMEDCKVAGYDIEKGTRLIVNVWAIGRDPQVWERPLEFDPERFMNSSMDVRGQDFQLLPFGSGRRSCPAITMGLIMVQITLANLLYAFDWKAPNEKLDMEEGYGLVMSRATPLLALATPRHQIN